MNEDTQHDRVLQMLAWAEAVWDALDLELEVVESSINNLEQCPSSEDDHCNDVTRVHDRLLGQRDDLYATLKGAK